MRFSLALLFFIGSHSPIAPVLLEGDLEFERINYPAAVTKYEVALHAAPDDPEVLWRLARVYVCMGEVAGENERDGLFRKAEKYARDCIRVDTKRSEGHTALAAALGSIAIHAGAGSQAKLAGEIKRTLDRAIELNPFNDFAYSILGSFYRALGNTSWLERGFANLFLGDIPPGGFEEAEAALKKAISLAPRVMRNHYELGVLYMDMSRDEEAAVVLRHAATLPVLMASDRDRLERISEFIPRLHQASE